MQKYNNFGLSTSQLHFYSVSKFSAKINKYYDCFHFRKFYYFCNYYNFNNYVFNKGL